MAILSVAQRHKTTPPYAGAPAQVDLQPGQLGTFRWQRWPAARQPRQSNDRAIGTARVKRTAEHVDGAGGYREGLLNCGLHTAFCCLVGWLDWPGSTISRQTFVADGCGHLAKQNDEVDALVVDRWMFCFNGSTARRWLSSSSALFCPCRRLMGMRSNTEQLAAPCSPLVSQTDGHQPWETL